MVIEGLAASQSPSRSGGILRRRGGGARISLGEDDIARFIVGKGNLMKHAIILAIVAVCGLTGCNTAKPKPLMTTQGAPSPNDLVATMSYPTCRTPPDRPGDYRYSGGPGDRPETAIAIEGSLNEPTGVSAEFAYVARHLPGWQICSQALLIPGRRVYDRLDLANGVGDRRAIYFDITAWFGKL